MRDDSRAVFRGANRDSASVTIDVRENWDASLPKDLVRGRGNGPVGGLRQPTALQREPGEEGPIAS